MNAAQQVAVEIIMDTLRALPWSAREEVMRSVEHNGEFCWHCGIDDPDCQCWNDE